MPVEKSGLGVVVRVGSRETYLGMPEWNEIVAHFKPRTRPPEGSWIDTDLGLEYLCAPPNKTPASVDWLDGRESCLIDGVRYEAIDVYEGRVSDRGRLWVENPAPDCTDRVKILVPIDQHPRTEGET